MSACVTRAASLQALAEANRVKCARVDLHQVIAAMSPKGGAAHVARTLQDPPDYLLNLSLRKFLIWIDRWGDVRAEALLEDLDIGRRHEVTVGELTERQVSLLTDALTGGIR